MHPSYYFLSMPVSSPFLILAQTLPHTLPTPSPVVLVLAFLLLTQHPRCLDVCGALLVGAIEQADDAEEDRLGGLDGTPALGGGLVTVLVFLGRVQDGDAQLAVLVNVGVERDGVLEGQLRRHVRVVFREN